MPDDPQPLTDADLDLEFAYTTYRNSCRDVRGKHRHCRRPKNHDGDHASGFGTERLIWPRAIEFPHNPADCDLCGQITKLVRFGDSDMHMWICERCNRGDI